jgi:hypothetical protein
MSIKGKKTRELKQMQFYASRYYFHVISCAIFLTKFFCCTFVILLLLHAFHLNGCAI